MTYKAKSLIYFSCFVLASLIYYGVEQQDDFQEHISSETVVETQFHNTEDPEKPQTDFQEEQQ
ncbi:hypothetical protein [Flagellimonas iocasae]|uniref:Secreted protein n=1 Tax=Flagellimonas iocasae TaxID=2055905 RepID=A0ABW4XZW9_9FLAO